MERVLKGKVGQVLSLLLIITFGILLGVTTVTAQESDAIAPDQSFDIITLLQGQSASLTVSQASPFGWHTVFVTSIGNDSLGASLSPRGGMGWWTLMVIGARSRTFVDYSFGLVPWSGQRAQVDLPSPGFGLVLSTVFYTSLEGASGYSLSIGQ